MKKKRKHIEKVNIKQQIKKENKTKMTFKWESKRKELEKLEAITKITKQKIK